MEAEKKNGSIRRRLVTVFALSASVVFFANMYMYYNINRSIRRIDIVYNSNVGLNELLNSLTDIQKYVYSYLNTLSSEALENYYRSEQQYMNLVSELEGRIINNDMALMQKNIKNMSATYLKLVNVTVDAKRGRNIEKYKNNYEASSEIFGYINSYINNLNNEQFKNNSINYELLQMSLRALEIISTIVLLVITLFNMILIIIVTRSITGPLMKLTKVAYEVAGGNFEVGLIEVEASDEVEIVTRAFNNMIISIRQYIIQTRESLELESKMMEEELMMKNHLKDAQLKYLQAQINPHFLFNTLNAGAQLAMMEGADKTCLYIENMADFFRFNMKSFSQDSSIGDEIKLVDTYIYILNVRFSGSVRFFKEIDESVLEVRVPSMILQPIVENSVNHGIRDIEYEGFIKLFVTQDDNYIYISIEDNGIGMEKDTIEGIINYNPEEPVSTNAKTVTKDSNGIGLGNVINRLRLYFNREDIFEIKSAGHNQGTSVTIHIPKEST